MPFAKNTKFPPSKYREKKQAENSSVIMSYPSDLGVHQLNMQFFKYQGFKLESETIKVEGNTHRDGRIITRETLVPSRINDDPTINISLPMPKELIENYLIGYNTQALGVVPGHIALNVEQYASNIGNFLTDLKNSDFNINSGGFGSERALRNFVSGGDQFVNNIFSDFFKTVGAGAFLGARNALGKVLPSAVGALDSTLGTTINPHLATLLSNIPLRSHNFSWKFSPRNPQETERLKRIFQAIKIRMHPEVSGIGSDGSGSSLLKYPEEVEVSFLGNQENLFNFKRAVITNFSIDHAPDSTIAFHREDGTPVVYDVKLALQEVNIITREDHENEDPIGDFNVF